MTAALLVASNVQVRSMALCISTTNQPTNQLTNLTYSLLATYHRLEKDGVEIQPNV